MAELRFCAYQYQNLPLGVLRRRWWDAERLGFDGVVELRHGGGARSVSACNVRRSHDTGTDGSRHATSIRVGTLVSSLYFRHPVTLTKAAMTLDHLSGGRLELALGVGVPSAAAGVDRPAGQRWSASRH